MNWFDLLLIGLALVFMFSGYRQGLLKQFVSIFKLLIAAFLAYVGSRVLSGTLTGFLDPEALVSDHPIFDFFGLDATAERIINIAEGVVIFLVLFVIIWTLLTIFTGGLKAFNRLPLIGMVNRLAGLVLGMVKAFVLAWLLIGAFSLVPVDFTNRALAGSRIAAWIDYFTPAVLGSIRNLLV
jgi:uncharacterized membrane protein required for colicin V production